MSTIPVPSLSFAGWIRSPAEKADALFSHFYESEKAQTVLYGDRVSNLQWIIEEYGSDIVNLTNKLRQGIEQYLSAYYDTVNVDITTNNNAENLNGNINITVYIDVTEDGKTYSFGKLLNITDSKIQKIIGLNNKTNTSDA